MSASGGKADIPDTPYQYPLMTQSGHSSQRSRLFAGPCVRELEPEFGCLLADLCFGAPQEGGNVADSAPMLNPVAKRELPTTTRPQDETPKSL
jgi:hypothetical protein